MKIHSLIAIAFFFFTSAIASAQAPAPAKPEKPPFPYVWAKAYHVLPETHNNESGYFSLVEGLNGRIYIGTAKYGVDSYLVEFDPVQELMAVVIDTHKLCGLPLVPTGYAAQAKIHTKNFVGPSGKVYVGSKQGYPTDEDKAKGTVYPGGYVMTFEPATKAGPGKAENLGQPMPLADAQRKGYKEGEGVIDVVADEERGLIYVVTCEHQHWMVYDIKTKQYIEPAPVTMFPYASTLIDDRGRAHTITRSYQLATMDPGTKRVSVRDMVFDGGKPFAPTNAADDLDVPIDQKWIPSWVLSADRKSAYLIRMNHPEILQINLASDALKVPVKSLGKIIEGPNPDCRSAIALGPDGMIYAVVTVTNEAKFGGGAQLVHLTRMDPRNGKAEDLGVIVVKNPQAIEDLKKGPDGKERKWMHGYAKLNDGTLTPQYNALGAIVARDGTVYVQILYPYTILRIDPKAIVAQAVK